MFKQYVVAYISFFDNELTQEVISADSALDAMHMKLNSLEFDIPLDIDTEEDIKCYAFNVDSMISAFEI